MISLDLPKLEDTELAIKLCNDDSHESVERVAYSIASVLTAVWEVAETLRSIKSDDSVGRYQKYSPAWDS